ncbi:UbiA family prenyltransferase [Candidatus Micrarchaeota archaeon]|nr:UbiA family prenyltransferase [Candidatus Micrarchaeota archaeon]
MENNLFSLIKKVLIISRPVAWVPITLSYLLGIFVSSGTITAFSIGEAILLSFPFCFYTYGINDIYDSETDKTNTRKKNPLWGQLLEQKDISWVRTLAIVFAAVILLVAISSQNITHILATLILLVFVYVYSAPPIRLKSRPLLDSLSNSIYALGPFAIGYSLSGGFGFLRPDFVLFALAFSGIHALGTIADMIEDKKAKITTFALALGPRIAAVFAALTFIASIPFAFSVMKSASIVLALYAVLSLYIAMMPNPQNAKKVWLLMLAIAFIWVIYAGIALFSGFERMNWEFIRG